MPDYSARSSEAELMDDPATPIEDLRCALDELEVVNRRLNGHRPSLAAIRRLLGGDRRPFSVLDVGTGCGDVPRRIVAWAARRGIDVRIKALDVSPAVLQHARNRSGGIGSIEYTQADILSYEPGETFDIVHAALVLHHFDDRTATAALRRMYELSRRGVVVVDLHRHPFAYRSFRLLSACFSRSRLIRNDGPTSVLRGFRLRDLRALASAAGLPRPDIRWTWGFRWQMVIKR